MVTERARVPFDSQQIDEFGPFGDVASQIELVEAARAPSQVGSAAAADRGVGSNAAWGLRQESMSPEDVRVPDTPGQEMQSPLAPEERLRNAVESRRP